MNGNPAAAMQARIGSASPNENKISGSPPCLRHSSVTIESFPPPTGTQVRRGMSRAIGAAGAVSDPPAPRLRRRPGIGSPDLKMAPQRDPVPEGELGKAFLIELPQEFGGGAIHRKGLADQRLWNKRFVVADPGHQKYHAEDTIENLAPFRRKLPRYKIKNQLFFKSWATRETISQRQGRDPRVVVIILENELLILHALARPWCGPFARCDGGWRCRDCLRSAFAGATPRRRRGRARRSPRAQRGRLSHRGRQAMSRANPREARRVHR